MVELFVEFTAEFESNTLHIGREVRVNITAASGYKSLVGAYAVFPGSSCFYRASEPLQGKGRATLRLIPWKSATLEQIGPYFLFQLYSSEHRLLKETRIQTNLGYARASRSAFEAR